MLPLASDADIHGEVVRGLTRREPALDLVRVQDVGLRTADDAAILVWAAAENRVLISRDRKTLLGAVYDRVISGLPMPGVLILRNRLTIGVAIEEILMVAACSTPDEVKNRVIFLPL